MESNTMIIAGLASLGVRGAIGCYGARKRAIKMHKEQLSSLVMSKGVGKTQLKRSLSSLSNNLVILDMDEIISGKEGIERELEGREYIGHLVKKFPKKRFLLLVSGIQESKEFGVDKLSTFVVCPTIRLFDQLKGNIDTSVEGGLKKIHDMESQRLTLIRHTDPENLNIFDSFDELYSVIKSVYKLQPQF